MHITLQYVIKLQKRRNQMAKKEIKILNNLDGLKHKV